MSTPSIGDIFSIYGSVIPRSLTWAIVGTVEGVLLKWASSNYESFSFSRPWMQGGEWYHPYSLHVLGLVLGFSLVMRIQIGYQRYWEATTQCHLACSKWADAVMQVFAFDEASKDAFDESGLEFRLLILHFTSLMTACALIDIRRDDEDLNAPMTVNYTDPYLFKAHLPKEDEFDAVENVRRVSMENDAAIDLLLKANSQLPNIEHDMQETSTVGGCSSTPDVKNKLGISGRMSTVPLQTLLQTRRNLQSRYKASHAFNSFEPIDAEDKGARPSSYNTSSLDLRCRKNVQCASSEQTTRESDSSRRCSVFPKSSSAQRRGACASGSGGSHIGESTDHSPVKQSTTSPGRLRRGSVTNAEYVSSTVFLWNNAKTRQRIARANQFDVVGGVSQSEIDVLGPIAPGDRAYVVNTWIVRMMTNRLAAGGLAIPPPLLSRTYQVISDGTAAAMQARKVSYVAFPFPLRQLLSLLLLAFMFIAPMCIAAFIDSIPLVGILSFFVCLGYTALNETAAEIESPFGLGANHHALTLYMRQFNSKLVKLLDLTIPELGYQPPPPPAGMSCNPSRKRQVQVTPNAVNPSPLVRISEKATQPCEAHRAHGCKAGSPAGAGVPNVQVVCFDSKEACGLSTATSGSFSMSA